MLGMKRQTSRRCQVINLSDTLLEETARVNNDCVPFYLPWFIMHAGSLALLTGAVNGTKPSFILLVTLVLATL